MSSRIGVEPLAAAVVGTTTAVVEAVVAEVEEEAEEEVVVGLGMVEEADEVAEVLMPITTTILGTPVPEKAVGLRQLLLLLVDEFGKGDGTHDTNVSDHERRMQSQMPKLRLTAKTKSKVKTDRAQRWTERTACSFA